MVQHAILDRIFDPFGEALDVESASRIAPMRADDALQRRLDELADKSSEGTLTDAEHQEYEAYVRAIDFMSIVQSKARQVLRENGS